MSAIHYDMPDSVYHASTALSSTGARKLVPPSTPAHFHEWRHTIQPAKDAFDLGHVVHRLVLGKGSDFVVLDPSVHGLKRDGTVADNPAATASWKAAVAEARAAGTIPIHADTFTTARRMADAVHAHPEANALFTQGDPEVSAFADDPQTGIPLRARFDWLDGPNALDVKTAVTAECVGFSRQAAKFGYHVQEMFYRHVAAAAGRPIERFRFVVVEKTPPHPVAVHEWDDEAQVEGQRLVRQAIDTYYECFSTNNWPAYPAGINTMSLPLWMLNEEMVIS